MECDTLKNKQMKKLIQVGMLLGLTLIAAGCVRYNPDGTPTGWVYQYLGQPASALLNWVANLFGGSYGMAIIIVTIIINILMLPSTLKMTRTSMISQARMKIAQPEIDEIKAEMEAETDPVEKAKLNQEMMAVYKKYDIDMFGGLSGCLPLLLQMPIISAVYAAIRSSQEIQNASFLGIHLGDKNLVIVVLVVIFSFIQGYMMQAVTPKSDSAAANQTTNTMLWMNPIMLGWISYSSAAGLGLYFLTGSIFRLIQQVYQNKILRPKIQAMLDEEAVRHANSPRTVRKQAKKANETNLDGSRRLVPTKNPISQDGHHPTKRNAGKQQRK